MRKCPRWFEPNWSSKPSAVFAAGHAITPALATRMWRVGWRARKRVAKARTECSEPSSSASTSTWGFPVVARTSAATDSPFGTSRAVRITCTPRAARTRAVSRPSPLDPPVTSATFPPRSMPSAASLAVVWAPNRVASRMIVLPSHPGAAPPAHEPSRGYCAR
jgi:hypothetical protein